MESPLKASTAKPKSKKPSAVAILVGTVVTASLIWGGIAAVSPKSTANYAEEVARPLDKALVKAGGTKQSSGGDNGRTSDNRNPYYDSIFEMPIDRPAALTLINQVARDNSYSLVHASPTNRGQLGAVADIYIDNWYFDNTSKNSSYSELEDGPVELAMKLGDEDKPDRPGHTTIRLSIYLPAFKQ